MYHGFTIDLLVELVRSGLATAQAERVVAGGRAMEIARVALAVRAQQGGRMRRIGVLMPLSADDPIAQARNAAFLQGLQQLGWTVGQNVHIEYRWPGGNDEVTRRQAAELATPPPEVILASGSAAAARCCRSPIPD